MALILLLAFQIVAMFAGFALLLQRVEKMRAEISRLSQAVGQADTAPAALVRQAGGRVLPVTEPDTAPAPAAGRLGALARAARAWRGQEPEPREAESAAPALPGQRWLFSDTGRGFLLALAAVAPGFAFLFAAPPSYVIAAGLGVAGAMALSALRAHWSAAAWAAALTGGVWAALGFLLGAAQADPMGYSAGALLAGACGLAYAQQKRIAPGAALALLMSGALLALGSQLGMISVPGAGFAAITALAAAVGASKLRLEPVFFAAFGAALVGLFILSGQDNAAIWFTPAAALSGAAFFAIAAIRAPQAGSRAAAIAGLGVLAPLAAIAALHLSGHGLGDPMFAAGAYAALSAAIGAVIAAAARRHGRGLEGLRLTLWFLVIGGFVAAAASFMLAAPTVFAAPAFMALALFLSAINARFPNQVWRVFAVIAGLFSLAHAGAAAALALGEAAALPGWAIIAAGVTAPAALAGAAAAAAHRGGALTTAAILEGLAFVLVTAAGSLAIRYVLSGGAPMLEPIGFVETGAHIAWWLAVSLILAAFSSLGARLVREASAGVLGAMAIGASTLASVLWLTPFWRARTLSDPAWPLLAHDALGFLLPALLFWAHWIYWRGRSLDLPTRGAIAAAAFMTAGFITLEVLGARGGADRDGPDWISAAVATGSFLLAAAVNFAPGVIGANPTRGLKLQKNLHRYRRRKKRHYTR